MNIGDLVKRKPEWGDWVKHNPWMYTHRDLQIGIIVSINKVSNFQILWPDQTLTWEEEEDLEKINEDEQRRIRKTA